MALFTKITIATLLCSFASATDCVGSACAIDDQTSLLQKQQVVTKGAKRGDDQPDDLDTKSPAHRAYDINRDEVDDIMPEAAAAEISRDRQMAEDRIHARHNAEESIGETERSVGRQRAIDRDNVENTAERHAETVGNAAREVRDARISDAEADHEKHMVEDAAVYGRHRGLNDGLRNAHRMQVNAQNHAIGATMEHNHEEARAAATARHEANVAAEENNNQNHIDAYGDAAEGAHVQGDAVKDHMADQAGWVDNNMQRRTDHFVHAAGHATDAYDDGALGNEDKTEEVSEEPLASLDSENVDEDALKVSAEDDLGEDEYLGSKSDTLCMNTKYIRIGAGDYFRRANAQKATLGSMGNYQNGYFQSQTMDFQEPPNPAWLDPHGDIGTEIETHIDMSSSEVSSFTAQANAAGTVHAANVKANGGASGSHSATAGFKTVVLRFKSRRALQESLNKDASRRQMLKNYASPRIVLGIMRLETAGDFADNDCLNGNGGASAGDVTGSMTASASGSRNSCSQMTASFSPGTVIAYRLGTPVFSGDTITKIDIDQPCSYLNPSCGCNQFITR